MDLVVDTRGQARCIYDEAIDLAAMGKLSIRRASYVEPDEHGHWIADLTASEGPRLGPFALRSQAIAAEIRWVTNTNYSARATMLAS